jgi:tRNA-modifying protein YgfZ
VHHMQPDGPMAYVDPRNAGMGFRRFAPVGSMINVPASRKYDEARIVCGLADSDDDIGVEQVFPHEANFDQFGAVSFSKGCFVGQEVVSRMQHRGTARSRMLPVFFSGVLDAKQVKSGDKVIGDVLSIAGHHGLALLRIDRLAESSVPLMCGSTAVHVNLPEWIGYDVEIPEVAR